MTKCSFCGLPAVEIHVDAIGHFGGSYQMLCDFCTEINDLLWDLVWISHNAIVERAMFEMNYITYKETMKESEEIFLAALVLEEKGCYVSSRTMLQKAIAKERDEKQIGIHY